jgi:hypothetical protein
MTFLSGPGLGSGSGSVSASACLYVVGCNFSSNDSSIAWATGIALTLAIGMVDNALWRWDYLLSSGFSSGGISSARTGITTKPASHIIFDTLSI